VDAITPVLVQAAFRGRDDLVGLNVDTWNLNYAGTSTINTNWTENVDTNFRVRFVVQETAGGDSKNIQYQIQYNLDGGGWLACGATTPIQYANTTEYVNLDATQQLLGSGTFLPGDGVDNTDRTGNVSLLSQEAENEYALRIDAGQVAHGETFQLRLYNITDNAALDSYTNTPTVTINEPSLPSINQESFRGRDQNADALDSATFSTATFNSGGGLNTNWNIDVGTPFRIRFLVQETNGGSKNSQAFELHYSVNGGAYSIIGDTTVAGGYAQSTQYANGASTTTGLLGSGTFFNGSGHEGTATTSAISFSGSDETEFEYALKINGAHVNNGDIVRFRLHYSGGGALESWTAIPAVTANKPTGQVTEADAASTYTTYVQTGQVTEVDAASTYTVPSAQITEVDAASTYTAPTAQITEVDAVSTYTETASSTITDNFDTTIDTGVWANPSDGTNYAAFLWESGGQIYPGTASTDSVMRRTDSWNDVQSSEVTVVPSASQLSYISAGVLMQSNGTGWHFGIRSAGTDTSWWLWEVENPAFTARQMGTIPGQVPSAGCKLRLSYDGTNLKGELDLDGASGWSTIVDVARTAQTGGGGNSTGTPGMHSWPDTGPNRITSWTGDGAIVAAPTGQITEVDAASTYVEISGQVTEVDAASTHGVKSAQVTEVDAASSHGEKTAQVTEVDAASGYTTTTPTGVVTEVDAASTYTTFVQTGQVTEVDAASTHGEKTGQVTEVDAASTYTLTGTASARITEVDAASYYNPFPASISGRQILDGNGNPIFLTIDSPWAVFHRLTVAERTTYLNARQANGFNAIISRGPHPADTVFGDTAPITIEDFHNSQGYPAFDDPDDWSTVNSNYFDFVAEGVEAARDRNMTVLLCPAYCGYQAGVQGWASRMTAQTDSDMTTYGTWLGNRFKNYDNIIWLHGGDCDVDAYANLASRVDAIQAAIAAVAPNHLHMMHGAGEGTGRTNYDPGYCEVDTSYSYEENSPAWNRTAYQDTPTLPYVFIEGRYQLSGGVTDVELRAQIWRAMMAGAQGQCVAHRECWNFQAAVAWGIQTDGSTYYNSTIYDFAGIAATHARTDLVPDFTNSILTSGQGTEGTSDYAIGAMTAANTEFWVYTPSQKALGLDLSTMTPADVQLTWINPATGATTAGTSGPKATITTATPPSAGDWVLKIDDSGNAVQARVTEVDAASSHTTLSSSAALAFTGDDTALWDSATAQGPGHYSELEVIASYNDTYHVDTTTADDIDQYTVDTTPADVDTVKAVEVQLRGYIDDGSSAAAIEVTLWHTGTTQVGAAQYLTGTDFGGYNTTYQTASSLTWSGLSLTKAQADTLEVRVKAITAVP
jgi:hypothetical protein